MLQYLFIYANYLCYVEIRTLTLSVDKIPSGFTLLSKKAKSCWNNFKQFSTLSIKINKLQQLFRKPRFKKSFKNPGIEIFSSKKNVGAKSSSSRRFASDLLDLKFDFRDGTSQGLSSKTRVKSWAHGTYTTLKPVQTLAFIAKWLILEGLKISYQTVLCRIN